MDRTLHEPPEVLEHIPAIAIKTDAKRTSQPEHRIAGAESIIPALTQIAE